MGNFKFLQILTLLHQGQLYAISVGKIAPSISVCTQQARFPSDAA